MSGERFERQSPDKIFVRHRIIKFSVNPVTNEISRATCVCEFEGKIIDVQAHIKKELKG